MGRPHACVISRRHRAIQPAAAASVAAPLQPAIAVAGLVASDPRRGAPPPSTRRAATVHPVAVDGDAAGSPQRRHSERVGPARRFRRARSAMAANAQRRTAAAAPARRSMLLASPAAISSVFGAAAVAPRITHRAPSAPTPSLPHAPPPHHPPAVVRIALAASHRRHTPLHHHSTWRQLYRLTPCAAARHHLRTRIALQHGPPSRRNRGSMTLLRSDDVAGARPSFNLRGF